MDPDLFNSLAGTSPLNSFSSSSIDSIPSGDLTLSAVDSSGNLTMPSLGTALKAGGSILGAFGDIMAGDESQQADEYNAQLALEQGQFELRNLDTAETDTLSSQHAIYAKAGVTMSGSPLDTAINTASQFEMDKQITNYNAQSKANMLQYEGKVAKQKGEFAAAESLLTGAAGLAMAFA